MFFTAVNNIISKLLFPKRSTKMIYSVKKHKWLSAFEFQNSCVFEKCGKTVHFLGMVRSSFSFNGHNAMGLLVVMHHSEFALLAWRRSGFFFCKLWTPPHWSCHWFLYLCHIWIDPDFICIDACSSFERNFEANKIMFIYYVLYYWYINIHVYFLIFLIFIHYLRVSAHTHVWHKFKYSQSSKLPTLVYYFSGMLQVVFSFYWQFL